MYYIYKQVMKNEKGVLAVESDVDFMEKVDSLRNVRLNYGTILDEDELDILKDKSREVWMITDQDYDVMGYVNLRQYLVVLEDENNIKESFVTNNPKKTVLEILSDTDWQLEYDEDVDYLHLDLVLRTGSFGRVIQDFVITNKYGDYGSIMIFDITTKNNTIVEMPDSYWLSKNKLSPEQFTERFVGLIKQCILDNEVPVFAEDVDPNIAENVQQCFNKKYVLVELANYYDSLVKKTHLQIKENIHE